MTNTKSIDDKLNEERRTKTRKEYYKARDAHRVARAVETEAFIAWKADKTKENLGKWMEKSTLEREAWKVMDNAWVKFSRTYKSIVYTTHTGRG